jgi:hypothetical protein
VLIREGKVEDMIKVENVFEIAFDGEIHLAIKKIKEITEKCEVVGDTLEVAVKQKADINKIIDILRSFNIGLRGVGEKKITLEDVFIETIEQKK